MSKLVITLTGRPPVSVDTDTWPVIASAAADSAHDGQVECQANTRSTWCVKVRRHGDGRAVVYARYTRDSNFQGARDYRAARGVVLPAGCSDYDICGAIRAVCSDIATAEHADEDAGRWPTLADECVADMPAEVL